MNELKPCPFCGCDRISVQYLCFRPYVICEKCHAQIPCYNTYAKAIEAWNRRVSMATKRVCDRCGAEINPFNSVTYVGIWRVKNDINDNDYELCVSCAHELRKWFNGEEADNGRVHRQGSV